MGNSYFQFKQFRIEQDACAMKVSTDACIQGAWTPFDTLTHYVLDVGTGTGLLSLMLAQRSNRLHIDAIEVEPSAAEQADFNVDSSPWKDRIRVVQGDAISFVSDKKYDLLICNPPFFESGLLGNDKARNLARHQLQLSLHDLFSLLARLLSSIGKGSILLPSAAAVKWEHLLKNKGWGIEHMLEIIPRTAKLPNRIVMICCRQPIQKPRREQLVIRDERGHYTAAFRQLMQPFYLNVCD